MMNGKAGKRMVSVLIARAGLQQKNTSMRQQDTIWRQRYKLSTFGLYFKSTDDSRSQKVKTQKNVLIYPKL